MRCYIEINTNNIVAQIADCCTGKDPQSIFCHVHILKMLCFFQQMYLCCLLFHCVVYEHTDVLSSMWSRLFFKRFSQENCLCLVITFVGLSFHVLYCIGIILYEILYAFVTGMKL